MELAHSYGVSRGPVREAIQRLVQEGLLRSEPHRGVFVPVLTDDDVADVYLARAALESAALRRLHRHLHVAEQLRGPRRSTSPRWRRPRPRGDWEAVGRFDLEFHTALVASTGSQRLQRMFTTLISETRLCLAALTGAEARHDLVTEHRAICDGIRDGDTERALAALEKHYDDAVVSLTSTQSQRPREGVEDR